MPSPYSLDLFAALEVDGRIELRVLYMEMAAPDTYWGDVHLPDSSQVLPGGWLNLGGGRVHYNRGGVRAICRSRPDLVVVVGYSSLTTQWVMRWLKRKRIPWVFWGEIPGMRKLSGWGRRLRSIAQYPALRWPDGIAAIGTRAVDEYRRLAHPGCEVMNIPYHTELKPFFDHSRTASSSTVRILFCGQLIKRKGVEALLDSFIVIADEFPESELLFVGEGPLRNSLAERVPSRLRARVVFAGFQSPDRLPHYFSRADVFVLPSLHDGWGVVVNQALGAGLPIICSSAVGAADLVSPGWNGFVIPPADIPSLTNALKSLLLNRERRLSFGENSRKAAENWVPSRGVDRWVELAERVLAQRAVQATSTTGG